MSKLADLIKGIDFLNQSSDTGKPNVYTIPPTIPFLDNLARILLTQISDNPIALTQLTILLPTRRACRSMRDAFLRISDGRASLLPKIQPVGEIDEDISILSSIGESDDAILSTLDIPPSVSNIERRLILTKLVLRWAEVKHKNQDGSQLSSHEMATEVSPAQASSLANELCGLMDEFETEQVDISLLQGIVPENYSAHWSDTLEFLNIVTAMWPGYLQERKLISTMERRNKLLETEAERLRQSPPSKPIIAAGITGSIPAAAELLKVIANLPNGAIILPGLDLHLDEESWEAITPNHPEHPQFGMKKLIDKIGISRSDIKFLPGLELNETDGSKLHLISEVMRPANTTHLWQNYLGTENTGEMVKSSLPEHHLITAPTAQDEAEVVSLIMRHASETPGQTVALVTTDRLLGRRVSVRLLKWGLMVDDSAGRPLSKTVPGNFMDLIAAVISKNFAASELMSLLKHTLCRLGMEAGKIRAAARSLEIISLRQPLAGQGLKAMRQTVLRSQADFEAELPRHGVMRRMGERDWERALDLIDKLEEAFQPITDLLQQNQTSQIEVIADAHIKIAEKLATNHEGSSDMLWTGEAGESLSLFFSGLLDETIDGPEITPSEYPEFYRSLIAGEAMRPQTPVHPRLFIWGPLEARLQQPDIIILGGLNEGTWPQATEADAWLSRPMRQTLGLPAPEQRTGLFAHDFTQLLGAKKIYMTRAEKVDGVPSVPSRWLLRLQTLLSGLGIEDILQTKPHEQWLAWAKYRDKIDVRTPVSAPEPCPPVHKRPRQLSVTQIEDWIKNPYVIFARNILRLDPLPELGCEPTAAVRGQAIHQALHEFTLTYGLQWPEGAEGKLIDLADNVLSNFSDNPRIAAFWQPRFVRFADWFVRTEPQRRKHIANIVTEKRGELSFSASGGEFTLTARADRIDLTEDNQAIIYDYKTGYFPNDKEVTSLKSPQLPLEAAILLRNGFKGINTQNIVGLGYISASGGNPAGLEHIVKHDDLIELAQEAENNLKKLVNFYDDPKTKYKALRRPQFDYRYDDYEHLSRVKEWTLGLDGSDAE